MDFACHSPALVECVAALADTTIPIQEAQLWDQVGPGYTPDPNAEDASRRPSPDEYRR